MQQFDVIVAAEPRTYRGDAHLVVNGVGVTLCSLPTEKFKPLHDVSAEDLDRSLCWVCKHTAAAE